MPPTLRPFLRAARPQACLSRSTRSQRVFASTSSKLPGGTLGEASASQQAAPIGPYYEAILITPQPIPEVKPEEPPASSAAKAPRSTASKKKAAAAKDDAATTPTAKGTSSSTDTTPESASASDPTFSVSSRLAGPLERADRLQAMRDRSTLVGGVVVPPRPEEPLNCCMSGCVNCVWETYRDEMEEWAAATARGEASLQRQRAQGDIEVLGGASAVKGLDLKSSSANDDTATSAASMDDDGGGSETSWSLKDIKKTDRPRLAKDFWDDALYQNMDVGIREFMKHEKKLKEKHAREGS
jgi:hypothetical protein